jgi:hypothetical protein
MDLQRTTRQGMSWSSKCLARAVLTASVQPYYHATAEDGGFIYERAYEVPIIVQPKYFRAFMIAGKQRRDGLRNLVTEQS